MPPGPAIIPTISPLVFEEQHYVLHSNNALHSTDAALGSQED